MAATVFGLDNKVSKSGDTMTGNLGAPSVSITHQLNANSGFETGLSPWVAGAGTPTQSATVAYKGTYSAKVVPDGVSTMAYIGSELIPCTTGQSLTVTGWVYAPIGISSPYAFSLSVSWYDVNQMFLSTSSSFAAVPTAVWTPVSSTYTAPAGAAFAQIAPSENGTPPATQLYYVDEVRIGQTSLAQVDQVITTHLQIPAEGASGYVLTADAAGNGSWQAAGAGGGAVSSVFTRTGAVVAASGDYSFSQVSGTAGVSQGGTGQTTQAAALTALAGTQSAAHYLRSDGTNTTLAALAAADLTGTVAVANGGTGAATAAAAAANLNMGVTAGTGSTTSTTTLTSVFSGPTIPSGSIAAGSVFEFCVMGILTTTAGTQSFSVGIFWGGIGGVAIVEPAGIEPNSGGAVTGVPWCFQGKMIFTSTTQAIATQELYMNYFLQNAGSSGLVTVVTTASKQIVIGAQASASAASMTCQAGYVRRLQ